MTDGVIIVFLQCHLVELQVERGFLGTFWCWGLLFVRAIHIDLRHFQGSLNADDLVCLAGSLNVTILALSQIDAQHNLLSLSEMLRNIIGEQITLPTEAVANIGGTDRGAVPHLRKSRMDDTTTAESIRTNTEKSLCQCACRHTNTVSSVTSLFTIDRIKLTGLSKVARR